MISVLGTGACVSPRFAASCLTTATATSRPANPENLLSTLCDWDPLLLAAIAGDKEVHSANMVVYWAVDTFTPNWRSQRRNIVSEIKNQLIWKLLCIVFVVAAFGKWPFKCYLVFLGIIANIPVEKWFPTIPQWNTVWVFNFKLLITIPRGMKFVNFQWKYLQTEEDARCDVNKIEYISKITTTQPKQNYSQWWFRLLLWQRMSSSR